MNQINIDYRQMMLLIDLLPQCKLFLQTLIHTTNVINSFEVMYQNKVVKLDYENMRTNKIYGNLFMESSRGTYQKVATIQFDNLSCDTSSNNIVLYVKLMTGVENFNQGT